ncbi:hypothetical protein UA08_06368 [Talaromyces atroroseus]|uniref:Uncharacterized protein n=1 Tax=Talaromyces atroroseus TaxID=1441469 RepID=A0A225AYA4_TALAT|nr:hypothetical protein UA08_06368 [Talaromyces atroroseus]OKL58457.1 hypothetical protein UA08_06368 [Talaromyces atroroseus]
MCASCTDPEENNRNPEWRERFSFRAVDPVRLFLEQLRSLTKQLGHSSEVLLTYNDSGARETIDELNAFVLAMAQSKTQFQDIYHPIILTQGPKGDTVFQEKRYRRPRRNFKSGSEIYHDVEDAYGQSWANAPRLGSIPDRSSGWTPLHQAVTTGASKEQITCLIQEFGALRLLRTAWTDPAELPYRDMTAAEIAYELGYTHLRAILAPIVYHCIPHDVLTTLQMHFRNLIRKDLYGQSGEIASLRLPDLIVLTELKEPLMWFPLKPNPLRRSRSYLYRLDSRDLLVKSFSVSHDGNPKLYRISRSGVLEIEDAITFMRS